MTASKNNTKVTVELLESLGISHNQAGDLLWFSEQTHRSMKKLLRWAVADFLETGALVELGAAYRQQGKTYKTHPELFEAPEPILTDAQIRAQDKVKRAKQKAAKAAYKAAGLPYPGDIRALTTELPAAENLFDRQVRASIAYLEK